MILHDHFTEFMYSSSNYIDSDAVTSNSRRDSTISIHLFLGELAFPTDSCHPHEAPTPWTRFLKAFRIQKRPECSLDKGEDGAEVPGGAGGHQRPGLRGLARWLGPGQGNESREEGGRPQSDGRNHIRSELDQVSDLLRGLQFLVAEIET